MSYTRRKLLKYLRSNWKDYINIKQYLKNTLYQKFFTHTFDKINIFGIKILN